MAITLRPISESDLPLLERIYASTRQEELAAVPWSAAERASFLEMQFRAQHMFYQEHFPNASFDLILVDGLPAGRLYVDRRADEIRIVDIALLLPEWRGQGIGSRLLAELLAEARDAHLVVRIHVEQNNRALSLYLRMGFRAIGENGVYHLMEWSATDDAVAQSAAPTAAKTVQ